MRAFLMFVALLAMPAPAMAQVRAQVLPLPPVVGGVLDRAGAVVDHTLDRVEDLGAAVAAPVAASVRDLADARLVRLNRFVRMHRDTVEMDDTGAPARAHEVLLLDPDPAALDSARAAGFALIEQGALDGLDVPYARLATPPGRRLSAALRDLRHWLPGHSITADALHFPAGAATAGPGPGVAPDLPTGGTVGMIDGGVLPSARIVAQAGFATGAPHADAHAQAIASLLRGAGTARIAVADVYGTDPAGGSALALARALGWMAGQGVHVISISLVGPPNPLLARAIAAAQAKGLQLVAAVGNDGAAAPPAYPASYSGVIAVTGVDGHGRVLFEAGRALHLDYAAPGADIAAIGLDSRRVSLRGTSFAAPLAAARVAATGDLRAVDREAVNPGAHTGRGIVCGWCRTGL